MGLTKKPFHGMGNYPQKSGAANIPYLHKTLGLIKLYIYIYIPTLIELNDTNYLPK